ncbi:MAG: hypothetical protein M1274_15245, partial [Actinobacteria bacterium]|nr:hypothetical protein [Actinomycetota bacterium]
MTPAGVRAVTSIVERIIGGSVRQVGTEYCFYVEEACEPHGERDLAILQYLLCETFEPEWFGVTSFLDAEFATVLEDGPP